MNVDSEPQRSALSTDRGLSTESPTLLQKAQDLRRAVLNLMEDAIQSRKAVEHLNRELRESERRFREMIDALPVAIYTTDAEGHLTHFSPAAVEFSGRTPDLSTDQWCVSWKLFHPEGKPMPHDECPMVLALKEGRTVSGAEAIVERPDGKRVWFTPYPSPLRDGDGRIVGGINMLLDITERKEAEERLKHFAVELEQRVAERTYELAQSEDHLRTLATELNLAEQRERKRLATELHDHLQQMLVLGKLTIGQGKRAAAGVPACQQIFKNVDDIFSDALTYTRTLVSDLSPTVLRDHGLPAALQWLGAYMQKHNQAVTVTVPDDKELKLPEDQVILLFQSVRELLINSSKHAGTGEATVRMEQRDGLLRIDVCDEGAGFDLAAAGTPNGGISSKFGLFSIRERMRALGGVPDRVGPEQGHHGDTYSCR